MDPWAKNISWQQGIEEGWWLFLNGGGGGDVQMALIGSASLPKDNDW